MLSLLKKKRKYLLAKIDNLLVENTTQVIQIMKLSNKLVHFSNNL